MSALLLQTAYLPPIAWCSALWNARTVHIEAAENYQKGSCRNRAQLAGPNGRQRISIPLLKGKHQQTPIRQVRIAYQEGWQRQHWRSIQTAYGNAPYFEHYADELRFFYTTRFEFLFDYNLELIRFILQKKMGWNGQLTLTDESGFSDRQNAHPELANLTDTAESPTWYYPQVFENKNGFLPNLSVLDLLFCCGKRGGEILTKPVIPRQ